MLDDPVTAQYTHTLTVTGRLGGQYQCNVTNSKPSEATTTFTAQGTTTMAILINILLLLLILLPFSSPPPPPLFPPPPPPPLPSSPPLPPSPVASAPTNLTAVQEGPTGIRVSWTPPTPLGDTTGYRIYYSGGSSGSVDVSGGSTHNHLLTGLQNGASYNISIVATSTHFYGDRVYFTNIVQLSESSTSCVSISNNYVHFTSLHCILTAPGQPTVVMVNSITPTTISLSWTAANGTVDSYEVVWVRDTSGQCPDVDMDNAIISGSSTSYTISELQEDSNYTIIVVATNAAGSAVSVPVTAMTVEAGEGLLTWY